MIAIGMDYLKYISTKILPVLDLERYSLSFVRNSGSRFNFVISITTSIAVGRHDQNILETKRNFGNQNNY